MRAAQAPSRTLLQGKPKRDPLNGRFTQSGANQRFAKQATLSGDPFVFLDKTDVEATVSRRQDIRIAVNRKTCGGNRRSEREHICTSRFERQLREEVRHKGIRVIDMASRARSVVGDNTVASIPC